jgi:hypothetical protein
VHKQGSAVSKDEFDFNNEFGSEVGFGVVPDIE